MIEIDIIRNIIKCGAIKIWYSKTAAGLHYNVT